MNRILIFLLMWCFYSCQPNKNDVVGIYISTKKNTIDSLELNSNGHYKRSLFDKQTKQKLFVHKDTWGFDDGKVSLDGYFFDYDRTYPEGYDFEDTRIKVGFKTFYKKGQVVIDYGQFDDQKFLYKKI